MDRVSEFYSRIKKQNKQQQHKGDFSTGPDVVGIESVWQSDQDGRTADDAETDPEKMGRSCRDDVSLMEDSGPGYLKLLILTSCSHYRHF